MTDLKPKDRHFIQNTFCTMYGEVRSNHTAYKADLARQSIYYNPPLELQVACSVYSAAISTLDKIRQRPEDRMLTGCKTYKRHLERVQKKLIRIGQKGGKWEQCVLFSLPNTGRGTRVRTHTARFCY